MWWCIAGVGVGVIGDSGCVGAAADGGIAGGSFNYIGGVGGVGNGCSGVEVCGVGVT